MNGVNGGRYEAEALAGKVAQLWGEAERRLVVVTGGEPLLQLDAGLIEALHARAFEVAVETNGTCPAPPGLDWICVSPKAGTQIVQRSGNELKLVWPQAGIDPEALSRWHFDHFLIQPMDGAARDSALAASIDFVMEHPRWKLSLQNHKLLGLP
jgi:7-carboxy-7-deazaguanine synthase